MRMLLIDAGVYIFRAFHALPSSIKGHDGRALNALHGYGDCLLQLLADDAASRSAVACFDESLTSSFRNALYSDYKATRSTRCPDSGMSRSKPGAGSSHGLEPGLRGR